MPVPESDSADLGPVDRDSVQRLWDAYRKQHAERTDGEGFPCAGPFGDSRALADELLELVLAGRKRATAALLSDFRDDEEPRPRIGDHWVACDGGGNARLVLRTVELRLGPVHSVDERFAWDEGEGDRSREDWLAGHTRYWTRTEAARGRDFELSDEAVFERFSVVWPPEHAD